MGLGHASQGCTSDLWPACAFQALKHARTYTPRLIYVTIMPTDLYIAVSSMSNSRSCGNLFPGLWIGKYALVCERVARAS